MKLTALTTTKRITKRTSQAVLSAALLMGVSGLAHAAQDPHTHGFVIDSAPHQEHDESHTQTSSKSSSQSSGQSSNKSVTNYTVSDGEHSYELKMEGGKYTVKIDGKLIPQSQLEKNGELITAYDKDGGVLYEFKTGDSFAREYNIKAIPSPPKVHGELLISRSDRNASGNDVLMFESAQPPKVMLGIYTDQPGESLREQLGIKGDAIIVDSVIKGLSADKAGIKDHDIILSIDGSDGVSSSGLTTILRKHKPGDEVKIVVLRKGKELTIDTELLAYDAQSLGHTSTTTSSWVTDDSRFPSAPVIPHTAIIRPDQNRFFSPQTQEETQERIIAALRSQGIRGKQLAKIEEEIRSSLDENLWSAYGRDGNNRIFAFDDQDDPNLPAVERQRLVESMQRKAEQAMRDAERMTLEFKDGQLLLKRHAEGLQNHIHDLESRIQESLPVIEEELQGRLEELESRFEELESVLDQRMESLTGLIERLIERLEED